jgi:predicted nucleic acid-binding protein
MARVIDTDIFSFLLKKDTRAELYKPHLDGHFLFLSFMTVAELERWAMLHNWGQNKIILLENTLKRYVVQHSNLDICKIWAEIMTDSKRNGLNVSIADAWVASTAISLQIPLVTNNKKDFRKINGLTIISETKL